MSTMISELIKLLSTLPNLGTKSAKKIALHLVNNKEYAIHTSNIISETVKNIMNCELCNNIDQSSICHICSDTKRDKSKLCIVDNIEDLWNIENGHCYNGLYYALNIKPSSIAEMQNSNINKLFSQLENEQVKEIIFANSPTTEGQTRLLYISDKIKNFISSSKRDISLTALGRGMPIGSEIDYLDDGTIKAAFRSRTNLIN
ncbi:recombination protein RecR [Rickettsiales bacterium]|nr:recombination protein RecR [Rickettsiales bacterium]